MRDWQLTADSPLSLRFAADARLGRTEYLDDQSWEIALGGPEEPALAFQTRYGGRAGLARLVPMFMLDGRAIYESMGFAGRPVLRHFTPNYALITARLMNNLLLTAELWVMASHVVGGRFTLENTSDQRISGELHLFAQVVRDGQQVSMNLLTLEDASMALHLGVIGNLNPVLLLEKASDIRPPAGTSPRLITSLIIPAHEKLTLRWTHGGRTSLNDSLQSAYRWLHRVDWQAELRRLEQISDAQIQAETGNPDWDAALAFGQQVALRSLVGPTGSLPNASFVTARIPARGFSARSDGSDHGAQWGGQTAAASYLLLPTLARIAPDMAKGVIRNFIAARLADGWIDFKPGLAGQRARLLSLPLLASAAWRIYEQTEDRAFIAEVYPALSQFFARWFEHDMDHDSDGVPEWTNTAQSGYIENPTFVRFRRWAVNADISKAESPDLAAYLVGEGRALQQMAALLGAADSAGVAGRIDKLATALGQMWDETAGSYLPRDRDTNRTPHGAQIFRGKGDESLGDKVALNPPNRLILRVLGGRENPPRFSAVIEGIDANGNPVAETVPGSAFVWYYGMGTATSELVYSQVNYLKFEGIIRLYSIEVDGVDLTRQNLTQLVPLWAGVPDGERTARILQTLTNPARYWRQFGLTICPADNPAYDAGNDGGSGGVWMFWNALLLEGLLRANRPTEAATLFTRLMDVQVRALRRDRAFREGYNSDTGEGLGDIDEVNGVLPFGLFMDLIGLRIINERRVWAGGTFALANPVRIRRGQMEITRSSSGTKVQFATGYIAEVGPEWQLIEDKMPVAPPAAIPEEVPHAEATPATPIPADMPEADSPSLIPVDTRKDETMEIPINQINFEAKASEAASVEPPAPAVKDSPPTPPNAPPAPPSGPTIKIPVRGPKKNTPPS